MTAERFRAITEVYPSLQIAVLGDFCLDRYLEIDPARQEISLETGLAVHNVTRVRSQPGAAGTIVNNLASLGVEAVFPIGFAGWDGEGFELWHSLEAQARVRMDHFLRTRQRRTFAYCKPLMIETGAPPQELNRLDLKNWTETPALVQGLLLRGLMAAAGAVGAVIVMDQVGIPETGVVTRKVLDGVQSLAKNDLAMLIVADSRLGLRMHESMVLKMNRAEIASLAGARGELSLDQVREVAAGLAVKNGRAVFVTLDKDGILAATPDGRVELARALPVRGRIDIVGAGDAVTANLTTAIVAGASPAEALELANAAASVVIHKLGTTGTASVAEIEALVVDR